MYTLMCMSSHYVKIAYLTYTYDMYSNMRTAIRPNYPFLFQLQHDDTVYVYL
jgi:hypothetical protein